MLSVICSRWWVLLVRGIFAIALGIMTIAWPGITLLALVWLFAAFTVADGTAGVVLGFRGEADGTVWWTMVFLGALAILAGIVAGAMALAWPELTLATLVIIIAASAIIRGFFEIIAAIRLRDDIDDEWILGLSGLMSVLFGGLIMYRPDAGVVAISLLIGAFMLAIGVLAVALSLRLRSVGRRLAEVSASN